MALEAARLSDPVAASDSGPAPGAADLPGAATGAGERGAANHRNICNNYKIGPNFRRHPARALVCNGQAASDVNRSRVHGNSECAPFTVTPLSATCRPEALRLRLTADLPLSRGSRTRNHRI